MNINKSIIKTNKNIDRPLKIKKGHLDNKMIHTICEDWYMILVSKKLCYLTLRLLVIVPEPYRSLIQLGFAIVFLFLYLGIYIFILLNLEKDIKSELIITVIINIASIIIRIVQIFYIFFHRNFMNEHFIIYLWINCVCYSSTIILSFLLLYNGDIIGLLILASIYTNTIIYSLIITGYFIAILLITLGIFVELIIRIVTCKMKLKKAFSNEYIYGVYRFGCKYINKDERCNICLCDFTPENCNLVALKCLISHAFHEECMLEWLKGHDFCPVCRKKAKFYAD